MSNAEIRKDREPWELAGVPSPIWSALKSSVYPGAKDESVLMVWEYCKGASLDPLQKPVHLVPMWIVDKKTSKGEMRDVVMPGIGTYRIQAYRSGMYVGMSEPEFGPNITERLGKLEFTYPEWCKITVKKLVNGQIAEFTAKEYWIENYANSGKDKETKEVRLEPNEMWRKRKHGQLAKCTEAQALRKAFPDHVSQAPTAEEMEGKVIDGEIEYVPSKKPSATDTMLSMIKAKKEEQEIINDKIINDSVEATPQEQLTMLVIEKEVEQSVIEKWLSKAKVPILDQLNDEDANKCIDYIQKNY